MSEDPTEHVQEHIQHTAVHGDEHGDAHGADHAGGHGAGHAGHSHASRWITAAALTAAFLAAFAAVTGALATKHLTESTLTRIEANDKWNEYGQKSVKNSNIDTRNFEYKIVAFNASLAQNGPVKLPKDIQDSHDKDLAKQKEYNNKEVTDSLPSLKEKADSLEVLSKKHVDTHETFEFAATMFHISIAIVAIAVVAKRKEFWYLSIVLGIGGLYFFTEALRHAPAAEKPEQEAPATAPEHPGEHSSPGEHAATREDTSEHHAPASEPAPDHAH